jgi:hypothetical protein
MYVHSRKVGCGVVLEGSEKWRLKFQDGMELYSTQLFRHILVMTYADFLCVDVEANNIGTPASDTDLYSYTIH